MHPDVLRRIEAEDEARRASHLSELATLRARIEKLKYVLAFAREAVAYHRLGYKMDRSDFDANTMLSLLDDLGDATDACE